ncbi:beta-catenin-like protein 1 [Planococcus citri]|uniref:beta-catenin-like protein 1 n=1 Tax=Planococcus citri TaxID=170843 RepID=UPI0031F75407
MDIGELLNYKPAVTPKRPLTGDRSIPDEEGTDYESKRKQRRIEKIREAEEARYREHILREERQQDIKIKQESEEEKTNEVIQQILEEESTESDVIDEFTLKKMVLLFEKRTLKNQEMRIKFVDTPEKFMESEIELHEAVQELHALATVPDLYPILVQLQAIPSLLDLLSHENTDISVAVVDLLQELTDVDIMHESTEGANCLIEALFKNEICALLVQNLERLDESVKEESDGVHKSLAIFENLIEFVPEKVPEIGKQGLMTWLLKRLKAKIPFDQNKLYASEILSILLQQSKENRELFGDADGVDIILQQLAFFKRHDPGSSEEEEMMENLFNSLCASLIEKQNRDKFLKGEGLQLMNLMLREKKLSRNGSLKVLNHSMSGQHGGDNCTKFVDILGLRTIFPLFMKTPKKNKKRTITVEEHEEHVLSIIASLLRHCRGTQRQRLMNKFTENDHEKVDRLLELHFKYLDKVELIDREVERMARDEDTTEEDFENEIYFRRLDGGLYTLQLIDYIILDICTVGPASIKQRAIQILNLKGGSLKTIRQIMREYAGNIGETGSAEWQAEEREHVLQLIDKF